MSNTLMAVLVVVSVTISLVYSKVDYVAYVFAGSARSFVMPSMKQTIRKNLIEAFCPPITCVGDVFVRVSSNDNNHVGIDAVGSLKVADASYKMKINESLTAISPKPPGALIVQYYEIGSLAEKKRMEDYGEGRFKHKVYRELDPRRYSMYFGRYIAYTMVLEREKLLGRQYTWVILSRLDTQWGEPIKPVHLWEPNKLYAPDIWYVEIPDNLGIMSRHISDIYFSLDGMMHPKVFCLGGPNLNTNLLTPQSLSKMGFTSEEIALIDEEDCRKKFPGYNIVQVPRQHLNWSFAGFSEYFLKRKMNVHGYHIQNDNVILRPFLNYIVRFPLAPVCMYVHTGYFISWLKVKQPANSAMASSCHFLNRDIKRYEDNTSGQCRPLQRDSDDPKSMFATLLNIL